MNSNRSHRVRLARAYAAVADVSYQSAVAWVSAVADAGLLPELLDQDGLRQALDVLLTHELGLPDPIDATRLPARYLPLAEILDRPLPIVAAEAVANARVAGILPATSLGNWHPFDEADGEDPSVPESDWERRLHFATRRPDVHITCPYPDDTIGLDGLPIDIALEDRERDGDLAAYETALHTILHDEPRDVDAFAHLGHLYWSMSDPASTNIAFATPPPPRQRERWLATALEFYLAGVAVGELSLPEPFDGTLHWSNLDNRPFLRAVHGLALTLWRQNHYRHAESVLLNMLWLSPRDNQGASILIADVRAHRRWDDHRGD